MLFKPMKLCFNNGEQELCHDADTAGKGKGKGKQLSQLSQLEKLRALKEAKKSAPQPAPQPTAQEPPSPPAPQPMTQPTAPTARLAKSPAKVPPPVSARKSASPAKAPAKAPALVAPPATSVATAGPAAEMDSELAAMRARIAETKRKLVLVQKRNDQTEASTMAQSRFLTRIDRIRPVCAPCNVYGTKLPLIGQKHAYMWQQNQHVVFNLHSNYIMGRLIVHRRSCVPRCVRPRP